MGYISDYTKPASLAAACGAPFWKELKPTKGDFSCLLSLFFDNLSTLVTVSSIFVFVVGGAANANVCKAGGSSTLRSLRLSRR